MPVLCELVIKDFPTFLILHSSITVLDISMECIVFHIVATVSAEILWLPRPTLDLSSANTFLWLIDRVYLSGEVIFPNGWFSLPSSCRTLPPEGVGIHRVSPLEIGVNDRTF